MSPLALAAYQRALSSSKQPPKPRPTTSGRFADKFVIRGSAELFRELAGIGLHHGRSKNSEMVAGVLEALDNHVRSRALQRVLISHLGEELSQAVLASVPAFDLAACSEPAKSNVRFPENVRAKVRDGINDASGSKEGFHQESMNQWFLDALVAWVRFQRQNFALLSACIGLDQGLIGHSDLPTG